ncbi:diacylglycerol/lipid kinase family protein [Flavobacterium flavipallidum]|uniref:Diacylglycerol kinase family protein n=1 Tax=Flavobacterium flavipallidum TaxID=3139140 RepID=A0ABU9HJF0_9FLAO
MNKNNVMLVVNPISGGVNKVALIEQLTQYAQNLQLNLYSIATSGDNDLENIRDFYHQYHPERVLIAGGDGTIKLVAEALEHEDVIFGILPVGSANGLATDLGLIKSEEENIAIAFQNHFVIVDCIDINGKMCLHLSDIGLNAKLIKNYHKSAIRGKLGYALQLFKTLIYSVKPFHVKININNQTIESNARMIVIANSQKYGTGVVINPIGIMSDGKFELVILKRITFGVFMEFVLRKISVTSKDVIVISTNSAAIHVNKPVSFQIDGEYCGPVKDLNINIIPRKLKIALPKIN